MGIAIGEQRVQMCTRQGQQSLTRLLLRCRRGGHFACLVRLAARQMLTGDGQRTEHALFDHGAQNFLLVGEVMEETAGLDAHFLGQHADGGAIETLLDEQAGSDTDQLLATG